MRVLAVDWSGDAHLAHRRLWIAEAREPGRLVRLEAGRDRLQTAEHLLAYSDLAYPDDVAIGLDFGFAYPVWYLAQLGMRSAPDLWAHVARHGEGWLAHSPSPFWGRRGQPRPGGALAQFRRTELAVPRTAGIGPKSMFQIGGAGAVGTGAIRGMPVLHRLHMAGATIWPFTSGGLPIVVEIYPRLLTGVVHKSDARARSALLTERYAALDTEHKRSAADSGDAFDAAVSALVMIEHAADLASLPEEAEPDLRLEGRIWHPHWRLDRS